MTELAARLSVVISGETDKNEDEDDAESESTGRNRCRSTTRSPRLFAITRLLVSREVRRSLGSARRIRDRWT